MSNIYLSSIPIHCQNSRQQNNMNACEYQLLKQLGGGQEGSIFLARREGLQYAIKELVSGASQGEAQMLASINHPGVIGFHEVLAGEPTALVLQYASEGDLAGFIRRNYAEEHVPEWLVRRWLLQLALTLHHLHCELTVIHRDIKLINVLVAAEGQLKLCDFGLARRVGKDEDGTRSTVGTPYYLAPESLGSGGCSARSDMWALGCLLFEICTGQKPFKGKAFGEIMKNILEKQPGELPEGYSKWLAELVRSLLDKNAEKRPGVQWILEQEEMQREFVTLRAVHKQYEKLNYPSFSLKTAKYFERESFSSNLKLFTQSLKTTRREKSIRLPQQEPPGSQQKKVERTKFAHKSLKVLLQRKGEKR